MRRRLPRSVSLLGAAGCLVLVLSGCGSGPASTGGAAEEPAGAGSTSAPGSGGVKIPVVASTNVYGSIAELIGGEGVQVTSIISTPGQDPHSFQANTQVALQLSRARLVIENGGGYDDFVDSVLEAGTNKPTVLNAVTISGITAPPGGELNEHIWFSFPSVQKIATRIAGELAAADPGQADTFTANARAFHARVDRLIGAEARLRTRYAGAGVGITEPVPLYLLEAAGLQNKTPAEFSEAVEEGEDVSAAVLKDTLDLYAGHWVKVLVYNAQTSGPVTEQVRAAAVGAGVPVVPVTETLPPGQTYLTAMSATVADLGRALAAS